MGVCTRSITGDMIAESGNDIVAILTLGTGNPNGLPKSIQLTSAGTGGVLLVHYASDPADQFVPLEVLAGQARWCDGFDQVKKTGSTIGFTTQLVIMIGPQ